MAGSNPIQFQVQNWDRVEKTLERLLLLGPELQRRYLGRMARRVIRQSQENIRAQREVSGQAFAPRKKKKSKGRQELLWKLARRKFLGVWLEPDEAVITYFNRMTGGIAYKHQYGTSEKIQVKRIRYEQPLNADKMHHYKPRQTIGGNPGCTVNQAAMLYRLGYQWRGARPGYHEIMGLVSRKQASKIIEVLTEKCGTVTVPEILRVPARPFLGATGELINQFSEEIMAHIYEKIQGRGHKV